MPFGIGGALTFVRDEFSPPEVQAELQTTKLLDYLPDWPWEWWLILLLMTMILILLESSYRYHRSTLLAIHGPSFFQARTVHHETAHFALVAFVTDRLLPILELVNNVFKEEYKISLRDLPEDHVGISPFAEFRGATWAAGIRAETCGSGYLDSVAALRRLCVDSNGRSASTEELCHLIQTILIMYHIERGRAIAVLMRFLREDKQDYIQASLMECKRQWPGMHERASSSLQELLRNPYLPLLSKSEISDPFVDAQLS